MTGFPMQLLLCCDDSYEGSNVADFDRSRGAGVVAFRKAVEVEAASDKEERPGDVMATWVTAVSSSSGKQPNDFGFLLNGSGHKTVMSEEGRVTCRGRSRSRSPSRSRDGFSRDGFSRDGFSRDGAEQGFKKVLQTLESGSALPVGNCSRGKAGTTSVCKFWLRGACARADCKFLHSKSESLDEQPRSDDSGLGRSSLSTPKAKASRHDCEAVGEFKCIMEGLNEDEEVMGTGFPRSRESRDSQLQPSPPKQSSKARRRKTLASEADASSKSASSGGAKQDKTLMCKFWLRNACQRTSNCNFAHGDQEQRAACRMVPCRFFQANGSCRQGDECWYMHDAQVDVEPPARKEDEPPVAKIKRLERWADLSDSNEALFMDAPARIAERWADLNDSNESFTPIKFTKFKSSERWADQTDSNEALFVDRPPPIVERWADPRDSNETFTPMKY